MGGGSVCVIGGGGMFGVCLYVYACEDTCVCMYVNVNMYVNVKT